ncbi:MAG TPA: hypothetical protein DCE41_36045 [Cytophagales bacterium]|nr:hypothetical protein [Cytophagales bacterium]HAA17698.1 hypothetical protein [Cytophagales bacterium]HAP62490.1 hypothetical protein [Cytophagales bacterium]
MSGTNQLKEAATILQEADVSDIVKSLALGIAEAQKQLDDNSVKQALILADPDKGIKGKSLLELGFTPAFYHFQYADISASISLKMKLNTDFELKLSASVDYDRQGGISEESLDYLKETESASHREGFTSSRQFLHTASESESLKINKQTVQMDQSEGAVSKVQKFNQDLRQVTDVERVRTSILAKELAVNSGSDTGVVISNSSGYVTITLPRQEDKDWGLYKMSLYDGTSTVDLDGGTNTFSVNTDYATTFGAAKTAQGAGNLIGFSSAGFRLKDAASDTALVHRFGFDLDNVDFGFNTNPSSSLPFELLAEILKTDSTAKIRITGYTDGSGDSDYNEDLSDRRAAHMAEWFIANGATESQIATDGKGEEGAPDGVQDVTYRRVTVELISGSDYLYFSDANFTASSAITTGSIPQNVWLVKEAKYASTPDSSTVGIGLGTSSATLSANTYADLSSKLAAETYINDNYAQETVNNVHYLLHNESTLKHIAYSSTQEEIEIVNTSQEASQTNTNDTSFRLDETENNKTRILKEADKIENPSTLAVGGSVDFRTSRQFEVSAEGNSAVSARLVSLPAPPEFLDEIKSYLS